MKKTDKIVKNVEAEIRESRLADTILSILKVGVSATTFGVFANLISEFIPNKRFLRLEKFAQEIAEELSKLDNKIDTNFITTDEFAFIFEQCFKAASENYQKEKLDSFKTIIVNSAINNKIDNDEREFFLNLTNSLTVLHLKILKFMYNPYKYLSDNNIPESLINGGFEEFFPRVFPNVDLEIIKMAFDDLFKYGLLTSDKGIFHTIMTVSGFGALIKRVSKNGERYINFISNIN
jgi:hypothetical protein